MKSKKVLAAVLSVVMLVASLPCIVLAAPETPEIELTDPETAVSFDLTEGVVQTIDHIGSEEIKIVSFTPGSNGRYAFMCDHELDLSVSVADQYGTAVTPAETEYFSDGFVDYMTLDAGTQYLFTISEYEGSESDNVRLMIAKSSKTLHLGSTYAFAQTYTKKELNFTPSESGVYVFNVTSEQKISGHIQMGEYDYVYSRDYSHESVYIYAYLTGGVTYPLTLDLDYYGNPRYVINPMKVTVTKNLPSLSDGHNKVTVKADNQNTFFQYIPEKDGVYMIYTLGEHSTEFWMDGFQMEDHHYGEGDNFSTGVCLKAGQIYFPTIRQSGSSETDIDVYIEKAPEITEAQIGYAVNAGDARYYSFTPSESGFYRFYSNVTTVNVRCTRFGQDGWNTGCDYFNAGETYMIWIANNNDGAGNIGFAWLYVEKVTNTLSVGESSVANPYYERYVYALFTPPNSGKYTFNIPVEYAGIIVSNSKREQVIAEDPYSYSGVTAECALTAGETYLVEMIVRDEGARLQTIPYTITKDTLTELHVGDDNTVRLQSQIDTYYSFTPEESGIYELCYDLYPAEYVPEVYYGETEIKDVSCTYNHFNTTIVTLEAGKEYTVDLPSTWSVDDTTTLYIGKVAELAVDAETSVNRPMAEGYRPFYAVITPEETGIYTISNGSTKFYGLSVTTSGNDFSYGNVKSAFNFEDLPQYILEAGKTYFVRMILTNDTNPATVKVTKDQKLEIGTNSVQILPKDPDILYDYTYTYFSFTAPEDGNYIIRSEKAEYTGTYFEAALHGESTNAGGSGYYGVGGNFKIEVELSKGQTYRLQVDSNNDPDAQNIDIVVERLVVPEERLEGYSLSLDGSIAVNLYMSLSDEIASSTAARLNVTIENGTTKAYSMSEATTATVNGKKYYVFHIPVAAKEMTATIEAQIEYYNFRGTKYSFMVQDYAKYILDNAYTYWGGVNNQSYVDAVPLVKALLNYGAYAQEYFGYKTDALANSILEDAEKILPTLNPNSIPGYNSNLTNLPSGVTFKSVSLSLESETELNLTFTNTTGKALSFTTDNEFVKLKVTTSGDQTKLKITGIPAHKVNEKIDLKVFLEGESDTYYVSYSPIYYCRNQIERPITQTRTQKLKDFMAAFYLYNQAARNYIDN